MQTFILVEAINIVASVFDTDQLSVIRGSSLSLKEAIEHIKTKFDKKLEALSTGASSGLFRLIDHTADLTQIIESIKTELSENLYGCFVFLVESCEATDLLVAKEKLLTQLRFHQMRSITTVPDRVSNGRDFSNQPCGLEGRRIAANNTPTAVQGRTRQLSQSVFERLEYGRNRRQIHHFQEGDRQKRSILQKFRSSDDFESLAGNPQNPEHKKLNNKIAVVYIDGNLFSAIQRETLERAKQEEQEQMVKRQETQPDEEQQYGYLNQAQMDFDRTIQTKRSNFLLDTLCAMVEPESVQFPDAVYENDKKEKVIRFETLLWGGDEMLFVLPAWLGFEFLQYFFEQSSQWNADGERLTHSAGLVFCHAKSPIHRIRELAKSLADTMKNVLGNDRRGQNIWDFIVLESIDYPGNFDIADFYRMRFGHLAAHRPKFIRAPEDWNGLKPKLKELIGDELGGEPLLSRRQLYRIARTIQDDPEASGLECLSWRQLGDPDAMKKGTCSEQDRAEHRMIMLLEDDRRKRLIEIAPLQARGLFNLDLDCAPFRACFWFHLIELWDYLIPSPESVHS